MSDEDRGPGVLIVCWLCAQRYGHIVWPGCPLCMGQGMVAAPVPPGIKPVVAARAATLGLDFSMREDQFQERKEGGFIVRARGFDAGIDEVLGDRDKQSIGRMARRLLKGESVGPKGWGGIDLMDKKENLKKWLELARAQDDQQ